MSDQKPKLVDIVRARQLRRKLRRKVCCSEYWVKALVVSAGNNQWETRLHLYPPGRKDTAMRECPACGRICPPNGQKGSPCCDCEVEESEEVFSRREGKYLAETKDNTERRERIRELRRRWWRRSMSYRAFIEDPMAGLAGEGESARLDEMSDSPTKAGAWPGLLEAYEGSALHLENDEAAPRRRSDGRPVSIETAVKWLGQAEKGEDTCPRCHILLREYDKGNGVCPECEAPLTGTCRRCLTRLSRPIEKNTRCPRCRGRVRGPERIGNKAPGCQIVLLSETESTLQKEINHYRKKMQTVETPWKDMSKKERESYACRAYGAVDRSAKRINKPYLNLKRGMPEDYLSVSEKFIGFQRSMDRLRNVEDWLTGILADGPVERDDIQRIAEDAGAD